MNTIINTIIAAVVGAVVAFGLIMGASLFKGESSTNNPLVGAVSRAFNVDLQVKSITMGTSTSGLTTKISGMYKGTCSLIKNTFTIAATTTEAADCAVTGVVSTDSVFADFATSTAANGGWTVVSSSASSTSNFITLRIQNNTGASAIIPASIASSTKYFIVR